MTMPNLAMLFGPTLMRSGNSNRDLLDIGVQSQVVAYLITNALTLFEDVALSSGGTADSPLSSPS